MSSKLFHTVVAFGISFGAMTAGCAAEPVEDAGQSEAAQTASDDVAATPPPTTPDRFCEVAWPTTKGGPRPAQAQACIDPERACGAYPGTLFNYDQCAYETKEGTCDFERGTLWMFCRDGKAGPEWACPTGTKNTATCVEPENAR